jgi:hypothetical protein
MLVSKLKYTAAGKLFSGIWKRSFDLEQKDKTDVDIYRRGIVYHLLGSGCDTLFYAAAVFV